jgi:hypothetical protein
VAQGGSVLHDIFYGMVATMKLKVSWKFMVCRMGANGTCIKVTKCRAAVTNVEW